MNQNYFGDGEWANDWASLEQVDFGVTYKPPIIYHPQRHENATFEQLRDFVGKSEATAKFLILALQGQIFDTAVPINTSLHIIRVFA